MIMEPNFFDDKGDDDLEDDIFKRDFVGVKQSFIADEKDVRCLVNIRRKR